MITIVKRPEKFTPAENPVIFQISSDHPSLVYFRAVLVDNESDAVVNQMDCFPTPDLPTGSYVNLSAMLSNTVRWELNNDSFALIKPIEKTLRAYRLKITERVLISNTGLIEDNYTYDNENDVNYVFEAEMGRVGFNNYQQIKYVINSANPATFLTSKPNYSNVNDLSAEHLYFLHDGTVPFLMVRIKLYSKTGSLVQMVAKQITDLESYKMFRLNVSPKALKDAASVDFSDVAYYTVDVADSLGQPKTVEKTYYYKPVECFRDYVNVLWVNSFSGLDSYQFHTPSDTLNFERFQIKKNVYGVNSDGVYSDINDGVYNPSDVIISNKVQATTKVNSFELNDNEGYWLAELYKSKQVFIELPDLSLVPVSLTSTSYTIPRIKFSHGKLNTIQVELRLTDGVIPVGSQAYANANGSIEFINKQMNTVTNNINGYGLTQEQEEDRDYNPDGYTENYS